jgi:hypothetical protein
MNFKLKCVVAISLLLAGLSGTLVSARLRPTTGTLGRTRTFVREEFSAERVDSLRAQMGPRIVLPQGYELPALIAFSYYPQLCTLDVKFAVGKINTTMQCQPRFGSLVGKEGRVYEILINDDSTFGGVLLQDVPFNAQIGVIGHELAHIVDYEAHSSLGIAGIGLDYLSEKGKTRIEHSVDSITVRAGLGWQLYDWAYFVLEQSKASPAYKAFKRKVYLQPKQIADWLAAMEAE